MRLTVEIVASFHFTAMPILRLYLLVKVLLRMNHRQLPEKVKNAKSKTILGQS